MRNKHFLSGMLVLSIAKNVPSRRDTDFFTATTWTPPSGHVLSIIIVITRSEARFARLLLDCELSYCFHLVIVVVGGRVHEWCKKGSGIKGHIL